MGDVQKIETGADDGEKSQETANGAAVTVETDADKPEQVQATDGAEQADLTAPTIPDLTAKVAELEGQLTAAADELAVAGAALAARDARIAELEAELTRAKAKPKASAAAKPAKARKLEPVEHGLSSAELLELINDGDEVVIAFGDGKREIAGLPPIRIEGDAWAVTAAGLSLRLPQLRVFGPAGQAAPYQLHGYALLIDGDLIAYAPRADVLAIVANSEVDLTNDVVF